MVLNHYFVFSLPCSNHLGQIYVDRMMFYVWDTCHIICMIHGLSIPLSHQFVGRFSGLKKDLHHSRTRHLFRFIRHFKSYADGFFHPFKGSRGFNPRVDSLSIEILIQLLKA